VTLAENKADEIGGYQFGGGIHNTASSILNMRNILSADNSGGDCVSRGSQVINNGNNFVGDEGCSADFSGDAQLLPLADNGGPTHTHAFSFSSPARDNAFPATLFIDQRGVARPQGNASDLGAYEWAGFTIMPNELTVVEGGDAETYSVALTTRPSGNVTIAVSPDGGLETTPNSLTFTPSNWNIVQEITVSAESNSNCEGNRQVQISHIVTGYESVTTEFSVGVSIQDTTPCTFYFPVLQSN